MNVVKLSILLLSACLFGCSAQKNNTSSIPQKTDDPQTKIEYITIKMDSKISLKSLGQDLNLTFKMTNEYSANWVPNAELSIHIKFNDKEFENYTCEQTDALVHCVVKDVLPGMFEILANYKESSPILRVGEYSTTDVIDPFWVWNTWPIILTHYDAGAIIPVSTNLNTYEQLDPTGQVTFEIFEIIRNDLNLPSVGECKTDNFILDDHTSAESSGGILRIRRSFRAECTIPALKSGEYYVSAYYSGDQYYKSHFSSNLSSRLYIDPL